MTSTPLLYAELLRNLRQISVFIDLPTPATSTTRLSLEKSGTSLLLHHESAARIWDISLPLPSAVKPPPQATATPDLSPLTILPGVTSWSKSLQLLHSDVSTAQDDDNSVPWSAPELEVLQPEFKCVHCLNTLLPAGKIKTWKDLPNHNWAEMMDFWHCHKPHEKGDTEKDKAVKKRIVKEMNSGRGIGGFVALEGVGLVDLSFLLVNSRDAEGVEVAESEQSTSYKNEGGRSTKRKRTVHCIGCKTSLGFGEDIDDNESSSLPTPSTTTSNPTLAPPTETLRLNKWNLCIIRPSPLPLPPPPSPQYKIESYHSLAFLSSQLIAMISDLAIRRFRLISETEEPQMSDHKSGLRIWVFHTDRIYSSASSDLVVEPSRGLKVYYSENGAPAGAVSGNGITTGVAEEDIVIPKELLEEAREALRKSTEGMPKALRDFRGWRAGNLERFEGEVKVKG